MAASSPSSSSSGISLEEKYEVFLSFRGEDTRRGFTSHLYSALTRKNVRAFIDDDGLIRGEQISPSLVSAIERSKIAVVVFSAHYASSPWCLDELVHIVKCKEELGQIVIPVFYHVKPRYVRRQSGPFRDEFAKLKRRFREKSETWSKVLTEVANLSGWDTDVIRHEAVLVQQIVSDIYAKLNYLSLVKEKELVGVEKHIKEIESLLRIGSKDVLTVGIWGIVGVGKSTIASVIYHGIDKLLYTYCFMDNVGERAERNDGLNLLREEILLAIKSVDENSPVSSKEKSGSKKVFMVFDNVTQSDQIDFLISGHDWFGPGSRIVLIARDEQVLTKCGVDKTYKLEGLLHDDALKLFNSYALGDHNPGERYSELSKRLIVYAKGAPLFLKLLGSFLSGKRPQEWEIALKRLERVPHAAFQEILQICYDGLEDREKETFSQILSSLNGVRMDHVKTTLQARNNFSPEKEINALVNKHLITITNNTVVMHDSLRNYFRNARLGTTNNAVGFVNDVRQLSPSVVVFVDNEGWTEFGATVSFRRNFVNYLEYYSLVFESLDAATGGGEWARKIEMYLLKPKIIAAVEGALRRVAPWKELFSGAGMRAVHLSQFADFQAECLLGKVQVRGFQVAKRQAELVLCWNQWALVATSVWQC